MENASQVRNGDLFATTALLTLGGSLLYAPVLAVEAGGRMSWLVISVAGLTGLLVLQAFARIGRRFPGRSPSYYFEHLLGKWPGRLVSLCFAGLLGLAAAVDLRSSLDAVMGLYFFRTPQWVVALLLLTTALFVAWEGIVHASRLAALFLMLMIATFLFTMPLLLPELSFGYLVPALDSGALDPVSRGFWAVLGSFRTGALVALILPHASDPVKGCGRTATGSCSAGLALRWPPSRRS